LKTRLIVLNSLLTAGVFSVVWEARMQLNYAEQTRRTHLENRIKPVAPPPIAPVQKPQTPSALRYEDVAKKDLFAADRNDDIIVDPPKVEAPKVMPPLPVVYGVMTLPSGTRASMAEKAGESSRMVHVGDEVGEFKIVALDARNVTFEWDGKELPHKIEDLIDRSNHQPAPAGQNQAASAAATPAAPPPPPPAQVNNHPTAANLGTELTASSRACQPGDTSPNGSVVDGYKKVMTQSIFGPVCRWVKQ
jgi:hypothetical protein